MDPLQKLRQIEAEQAALKYQLAQGKLSEAKRISLNSRLQGLSNLEATVRPYLRQPGGLPFF
jgi:hypothetical protein